MLALLFSYTEPSDISRARVWFFEGKRKTILYTERSHFYHRYKVKLISSSCCQNTNYFLKRQWHLYRLVYIVTHLFGFTCEQIRGIQNLIIYSLPERKEFYPEVSMISAKLMTLNFSQQLIVCYVYLKNLYYLFVLIKLLLQIVNMLEGSHNMTCTVLFSRFDMLRVMDLFPS